MLLVPLRDGAVEVGPIGEGDQTVPPGLRERVFELIHRGRYPPREPQLFQMLQVILNIFFVISHRKHILQNGERETLPDYACNLERELLGWREAVNAARDDALNRVRNVQIAEGCFQAG